MSIKQPGDEQQPSRSTTGTQALDGALELLLAMTAYGEPVGLSELARACGIQPSRAHRYLASFMKAGLVEQTGRSGKYYLGKQALRLGLSAMARHDFVNDAADGLQELCVETGLTALLSVWGNQGATVVRWERSASPTVTSMGLGTALPLLNSASGRVFLTWAPQEPLKAVREAELRRLRRNASPLPDLEASDRGVEDLRRRIRDAGYACVDGKFIPGLVAIAAPVLDWQGQAQAAITLIGTDPAILEAGSVEVRALTSFCASKSVDACAGKASAERQAPRKRR